MMQSEMLPIVSVWLSWKMIEEMEDVYNRMIDDRNALRDATAALTSAPLPNEPAADEEETVRFVTPVKVRALCSHEGAKISSGQEDYVLGMVHSKGHAVWRDA